MSEIEELKKEIQSVRKGKHSCFLGFFQGFVISILTWFVVTPIVQTVTVPMLPFKWLAITIDFIAPAGVFTLLWERDRSSNKGKTRIIVYTVLTLILVIYYMIKWFAK